MLYEVLNQTLLSKKIMLLKQTGLLYSYRITVKLVSGNSPIPRLAPPCGLLLTLLQKLFSFMPRSPDGSLFSFAISGAVPVDLQESSFLFGGELANLHKNSATL